MRTPDLEKLIGSYVLAEMSSVGEPETVRLLGVREPTEEETRFGHVSKRVDVRRFLLGGYIDTWVLPRDIVEPTTPNANVLAVIEYIEREIGPKEKR